MSRPISILVILSVMMIFYILIPSYEFPKEVRASNKIDKRILKLFNRHQVGGAYLISQNGEIKHEKYAGFENYYSKNLLNESSLFSLGTLSQQYLGHIYHSLIEKEVINPDFKVDLYVNDLDQRLAGEQSIRDLLVMKSRLPKNFKRGRIAKWQVAIEPTWEELRYQISDMTPAITCPQYIEDGCYSDVSYTLLGVVLQVLMKKDYGQIFKEKITDKFELKNTHYNLLNSDDLVRGHYPINESKMSFAPTWDHQFSVGNSGVKATLRDFHQFQLAITDQLVAMEKPQKYFDLANFFFGWMKEKRDEDFVYWHKGEDVGFYSLVVRVPAKKLVAIFLFNVDRNNREDFHESLLKMVFSIIPKF